MCSPLTLLLPSYPLPSAGLMASSIAIPQGLTVAQRDNSSDLNTITIRWSLGVPFVLSEVVYRCSYTLQRTDGVNVTDQTMVHMYLCCVVNLKIPRPIMIIFTIVYYFLYPDQS